MTLEWIEGHRVSSTVNLMVLTQGCVRQRNYLFNIFSGGETMVKFVYSQVLT